MAETVRGSIGQEQVFLENAATEATLLKLIEAVQQSGGAGAATRVAGAAGAAGINTETVKKANESISFLDKASSGAALGLGNLYGQLISGNPSISATLSGFKNLPGPIGWVAEKFALLAQFQETNMKTYRDISQAGVNFGGSLTDLRMASANAYVTLQEFGNILKNNSKTLAMMGGSANDGAMAFAKMSNQLISSTAGSKLMALGYTAEDVNNGMLNYIAITGGRTKAELANSEKITAASAAYLEELDKLSQFTGMSRKELEEEQKKAAAQAAFQRKLQSLNEEERAKLQSAYDRAAASKVAGATDAVMSVALGMPPLTKEAQQLAGTLPGAYNGLTNMTNTAMRTGSTMEDVRNANGQFVMGVVDGAKRLGRTGDALSLQGNKTITSAIALENQMNAKGIKTAEDHSNAMREIDKKQAEQANSQAATMVEAEKTLKEFGQTLMSIVAPIVAFLTPALQYLGPALIGLSIAVIAVKTAMITWQAFLAARNAARAVSAAGGGVGGVVNVLRDRITGGGGAGGGFVGPPRPPVPPTSPLNAMPTASPGGGGFVGFVKALGRGIASLAPIAVPMLIGAGALAGVIAILGVGIAAAIAVIGKGLPIFAEGLKPLAEINGLNLIAVAGGIAALGLAMVAFTAGSVIAGLGTVGTKIINFFSGGGPVSLIKDTVKDLTPILPQLERLGPSLNSFSTGLLDFGKGLGNIDSGKVKDLSGMLKTISSGDTFGAGLGKLTPILPQLTQIGPALNSYANGIVAFGKAINTVDLAKAEKLKEVMKGPGLLESISASAGKMVTAATNMATGQSSSGEKTASEIAALNSTMREILRYVRDTAEHTKNTHNATKSLNPNLFA